MISDDKAIKMNKIPHIIHQIYEDKKVSVLRTRCRLMKKI
jgi:hypothetical protein